MGKKGSCLYGEVTYEIDSVHMPIMNYYCQTCRKTHAAPFASTAGVKRENFHWLSGLNFICTFESSPWKVTSFLQKLWFSFKLPRGLYNHV